MLAQQTNQVPIKVVGSNKFGRYPKISVEQTFNMIISDEALVPYAGYKSIDQLSFPVGQGRALYASARGDLMIAVISGTVFRINADLSFRPIGPLATSTGNVFIAENNNNQIAISDFVNLYVYDYTSSGTFSVSNLTPGFAIDFRPGYLSFQNGRLQAAGIESNGASSWRLSGFNDALSWPSDSSHVSNIQAKPDVVQASVPFPGRGNVLFLFGKTVTQQETDVGAALFPYQRSSNFNIDYGCLNPATIASLENFVVWLSGNEKTGPIIMYSTGGESHKLSNDGIDFKLSKLVDPENSYGFLFKQDGHLIYQITFLTDNLSYIYDFNTQMFFTVTDENLNYHIARQVVFFNNKYYFVSFNDGDLYEFGTQFTDFEYANNIIREIPRIRICEPQRLSSQKNFIINSLGFMMEMGQDNPIDVTSFNTRQHPTLLTTEDGKFITTEDGVFIRITQDNAEDEIVYRVANMRVDLSISRDGGESFGGSYSIDLNPSALRRNRLMFYRLGIANDTTIQIRFWGFKRFVCFDGVMEIAQ